MYSCNNSSKIGIEPNKFSPKNPEVQEILSSNKDADIFLIDVVYINAEENDVSWVNDLDLSLGNQYYEITKQATKPEEFESGTATKLPVGTKIYKPNEKHGPILIAVVNGKEIRYLGQLEG